MNSSKISRKRVEFRCHYRFLVDKKTSREGLILFSGGRETARNLVKQRLKSFNEAFDQMYQKESNWFILDKEEELRDRVCHDIIQTVVPVYRSYMQNYGLLVEQDHSASKYVKFTAQSMDGLFNSLFHQKPTKQGSLKVRQRSGNFNNGVAEQYQTSPAVK